MFSLRNREAFAPGAFAHVHAVERIPWPNHGVAPESHAEALSEVLALAYDVALIASEEPDAYTFAREARIPRRVGFVNGWEKLLKTLRVRPLLTSAIVRPASAARAREHEVETLFRLGEGLHRETAPTRELARLRPLLLEREPDRHGRIVVQLNAKFARAGLDAAAFAAIARELERREEPAIATGDDDVFGSACTARSTLRFFHPASLGDWKALIGGARAVITPDSGAAHVAGMLGIPCVVIFPFGSNAPRDLARWRPWAARSYAVVMNEGEPIAEGAVAALDAMFSDASRT